MNPILLAIDGSPSATAATEYAIALAESTNRPLHVVTAWAIPTASLAFAELTTVLELETAAREHAEAAATAAAERAARAHVAVTSSVRAGDAVDEICAAAREVEANVVVVGARGWSGAKRLFFGSVSNGVLHSAPCPVLVVKGDTHLLHERREAPAAETADEPSYEGRVLIHEP